MATQKQCSCVRTLVELIAELLGKHTNKSKESSYWELGSRFPSTHTHTHTFINSQVYRDHCTNHIITPWADFHCNVLTQLYSLLVPGIFSILFSTPGSATYLHPFPQYSYCSSTPFKTSFFHVWLNTLYTTLSTTYKHQMSEDADRGQIQESRPMLSKIPDSRHTYFLENFKC